MEPMAAGVDDGAPRGTGDGVTVRVEWSPPPGSGPVLGYRVAVIPTGETVEVAGDTSALMFEPEPGSRVAFQVAGDFGDGFGPVSSASLLVDAGALPPTTTAVAPTTVPPIVTSTTPATSTTESAAVANPPATNAPTAEGLPITEASVLAVVVAGLVLVAVGGLALAARRR